MTERQKRFRGAELPSSDGGDVQLGIRPRNNAGR
jgi:hypothetical protein